MLELIALALLRTELLTLLLEEIAAGIEELLKTTVVLLAIAEDDAIEAGELDAGSRDDEDTADELLGMLAAAWLLDMAARLLELTEDALLTDDFTEDDDLLVPVPGVVPPPPPQAVNAAESDTAVTIRKE